MVDLIKVGMFEYNGVLVQQLEKGKAMQVRLEPNRVDVRSRQVPVGKMTDTESETPPWFLANGYILAHWREQNSTVWKWLLEKGLDETAAVISMMKTAIPMKRG